MYDADYYSPYYYRFANTFDIVVSAGIHIQLTKRTGMTSRQLRRQAREMIYREAGLWEESGTKDFDMVLIAEALDAACRKCVRVEVSDVPALARVLDGMGLAYKIVSDTTADVFAKVNVTRLVMALAKENCEVLSMSERDESLESYFISLIGGGRP